MNTPSSRSNAVQWLKAIVYTGIYGGLLVPAMFIPIVIFPFVFSKLIFFQILIGLTFPAYVALAWMEPRYRPRFSLLSAAIVAYFAAIGLSVLFSVDPLRSWWGNQERMNGLFTLLHFFAWFIMTSSVLTTWKQWRRLLMFEVAISVFMAAVALLQIPFPRLLRFPAGPRVGGLLDNPIYMGAYQIFNLAFIALLWLKDSSRSLKVVLAFAAIFDIAAFIATQSRGALVGLGAGLVAFGIAYAFTTTQKRTRWVVLGTIAAMFAVYGLLFAARHTSFVQETPFARLTSFNAGRPRLIAWEIAWKGFLERPLTGWGFDVFHILFNQKYNPESLHFGYYETWFDRSHNTIMDILSMTGTLGIVTFAAIYFALFWSVFRAYRRHWMDGPFMSVLVALPIAYFVQNLFVFDHPAAFSMSYLMYALIVVATTSRFFAANGEGGESSTHSRAVSTTAGWTIFAVLQIAFLIVIWRWSWLPARASMLTIDSNNLFAAGRYEDAYHAAQQAFTIPTPYLDEQTFLQSRNMVSLAGSGKMSQYSFWRDWHDLVVRINQQYLAEHSRNTNPHFIFARFAESMSAFVPEDKALAEQHFKKAIEFSPKRQQLYYGYARFLVTQNRNDEALDYMKKVLSFDEEVGESHWLLGLHYFYDRDLKKEGAEEMVKALTVRYPYQLQGAQEVMALAMAYDALNDKDGLKSVMTLLPKLPQAQLGVYLQIAGALEHQGMLEERNRILEALSRMNPEAARQLEPVLSGKVTTIQSSLQQTAKAPVTTEASTSTSATSSARSGGGPRK